MGTFCLSVAPILRCESLSLFQTELLVAPAGAEVIFATVLLFAKWNSGRRHLLLVAEGWTYFALAILEMLSHILPAVRQSVSIFRILDLSLAAANFLPIFFHILFLWLLVRDEVASSLPKRFQNIVVYLLLLFIPAIIVLNELSNFIGIQRIVVDGELRIGFDAKTDTQTIWIFFSAITLALLTAYQAICFTLVFFRLVKAAVNQRRIETASTDARHMFRGVGWIAMGLKLGAIETVIGFAEGNFGTALTRRILRFLGRALLIIGIVKGMDMVEDFSLLQFNEKGEKRDIRRLVSNPRYSTFKRISSNGANGYDNISKPGPLAPRRTSKPIAPVPRGRPGDRVTIHVAQNEAPTLEMRFSALDLPSPSVIVESVKSRPASEWTQSRPTSSLFTSSSYYPPGFSGYPDMPTPPMPMPPPAALASSRIKSPMQQTPGVSPLSANSNGQRLINLPSDRERTPELTPISFYAGPVQEDLPPAKRKPPPAPVLTGAPNFASLNVQVYNELDPSPVAPSHSRDGRTQDYSQPSDRPVSYASTGSTSTRSSSSNGRVVSSGSSSSSHDSDSETPATAHIAYDDIEYESALLSGKSLDLLSTPQHVSRDLFTRPKTKESELAAYRRERATTAHRDALPEGEEFTIAPEPHQLARQRAHSEVPWMSKEEVEVDDDEFLDEAWKSTGLVRIKSMSKTLEKRTPAPSDHEHSRTTSMTVEGLVMPTHHRGDSASELAEIAYSRKLNGGAEGVEEIEVEKEGRAIRDSNVMPQSYYNENALAF